ncbi:MAG: DUF5820 family protein [Haloferacaceae archaeon]
MADDAPDGWTVWSDEADGRRVLAFRPDVFDSQSYPAPCLPTIYVSNGSPKRRPGAGRAGTGTWHVTLFLEPEIEGPSETYPDREAALAGADDLAARFAADEVDARSLYQVPREEYLDRLAELTGPAEGEA